MKKILTIALALLMVSSCFAVATSAAAPEELVIDMANDLTVLTGCEDNDNKVTIDGVFGAYSKLEDGKIVIEANGVGSTEQYPRPMVLFKKQIPTATYKWMTIDVKYADATLNHYKNGATKEFNPFIKVGYVNSDITTYPTKLVEIGSKTGSLLTTPETFADDYVNKTFNIDDVKDKSITFLIQLPDAAAEGFSDYLNIMWFQPFGWGAGCTNNCKIEISAIKFYSANPYVVEEDTEDTEPAQTEDTEPVQTVDTTPDTNAPETNAPDTSDTPAAEEKGCGGVIGGSVLAVAAIAGAVILTKKKKEN